MTLNVFIIPLENLFSTQSTRKVTKYEKYPLLSQLTNIPIRIQNISFFIFYQIAISDRGWRDGQRQKRDHHGYKNILFNHFIESDIFVHKKNNK